MIKKFSIIVVFLFVLISCKSAKSINERDAIYITRAESAILKLAEDISIYSEDSAIDLDTIENYLPSSYLSYKDYSPIYSEVKKNYIDQVDNILSMENEKLDALFLSYSNDYINIADSLISSDTALVDKVRGDHYLDFVKTLNDNLESSEELKAAFDPSYVSFTSLSAAYKRLADIGVDISIPLPDPIDIRRLSSVYISSYFERLSLYERQIKNTRIDYSEDAVYSIFWEE